MAREIEAHTFELLEDTRMQVLVHIPVLERKMRGLLSRVDRGIEVRELVGEAHAHLERISHSRQP